MRFVRGRAISSLWSLTTLLLLLPAWVAAQSGEIEIRNLTGRTIFFAHVTHESVTTWGADLLGGDVLSPGQSMKVRLPIASTPYFDIRLVDRDRQTYTFSRFNAFRRVLLVTAESRDRNANRGQRRDDAPGDSTGTGFAIASGLLVTNEHVVSNCRTVNVVTPRGRLSATVVDADPELDLALIRAIGLQSPVANLRTKRRLELGEDVFAFGFPLTGILASDGNFTSGMISALRGLRNSETRFQHTAPVQPGNSGGPLVDAAGNVIGVIVGRLNSANSQVVNFAVSQRVLERFLERNRVSTEPAVERRLAPPEIARLAQAFTFRIECLSSGSLAESARAQAAEQRRADEERERHEAERRRVEAEAAARRAAELAEAERRAEAARDEARREREREVDLARRERARLETEQRELEDRSRGTEAWNAFASRIGDALRSNTVFPGSFTPQALRPAIFRVSLRLDCSVEGIELTTSSGLDAWDRAVESAILRTSPFPALEDRRCPRSVTVAHTPIEAKDAASNGPAAPIDSATAPTSIPANARALPTGGWECRTGYVNYFGTSCVRLACPNGYVAYEGRMCVPLR